MDERNGFLKKRSSATASARRKQSELSNMGQGIDARDVLLIEIIGCVR